MQEIYTNKQDQEQLIEKKQLEKEVKKKKSHGKKEVLPGTIPIEITNLDNQQTISSPSKHDKHRSSFSRVKPFKEMDLYERLEYLVNFPKVLPPVPCVFITVEGNYQGYLTEYDEHQVTIQFHDQTSKTLPLDEIKDVIMIGIKK
jgi:hypothetical protein